MRKNIREQLETETAKKLADYLASLTKQERESPRLKPWNDVHYRLLINIKKDTMCPSFFIFYIYAIIKI